MKIYFDIDENRRIIGYGSSPMNGNCIEYEIDEDHEVFTSPYSYVIDEDLNFVYNKNGILEEAKSQKDRELNFICNKIIIGKFSVIIGSETYYFSNDMEAQINFDKMARAFDKEKVEYLPWTVYKKNGSVERIVLDPEVFELIYDSHLMHIQGCISRYRDILMPKITNAKTVEEVNLIHWNMEA